MFLYISGIFQLNMESLDDCIIGQILSYLDPVEALKLRTTCRVFRDEVDRTARKKDFKIELCRILLQKKALAASFLEKILAHSNGIERGIEVCKKLARKHRQEAKFDGGDCKSIFGAWIGNKFELSGNCLVKCIGDMIIVLDMEKEDLPMIRHFMYADLPVIPFDIRLFDMAGNGPYFIGENRWLDHDHIAVFYNQWPTRPCTSGTNVMICDLLSCRNMNLTPRPFENFTLLRNGNQEMIDKELHQFNNHLFIHMKRRYLNNKIFVIDMNLSTIVKGFDFDPLRTIDCDAKTFVRFNRRLVVLETHHGSDLPDVCQQMSPISHLLPAVIIFHLIFKP
jgi:hypothetical protein